MADGHYSSLPQELCNTVAGCLEDADLWRFSAVCRSARYTAQPQLYATLACAADHDAELDPHDTIDQENIVLNDDADACGFAESYWTSLSHQGVFDRKVRSVMHNFLSLEKRPLGSYCKVIHYIQHRTQHAIRIPDLLRHLPHLEAMILEFPFGGTFSLQSLPVYEKMRSVVVTSGPEFALAIDIDTISISMPRLESLSLCADEIVWPERLVSAIKCLDVGPSISLSDADRLLATCTGLESFTARLIQDYEPPWCIDPHQLVQLLQRHSDTLQAVHIEYDGESYMDEEIYPDAYGPWHVGTGLAQCSKIKELSIETTALGGQDMLPLSQLISCLPCSLEVLTLLDYPDGNNITSFTDSIPILKQRCPGIKSFIVFLGGNDELMSLFNCTGKEDITKFMQVRDNEGVDMAFEWEYV